MKSGDKGGSVKIRGDSRAVDDTRDGVIFPVRAKSCGGEGRRKKKDLGMERAGLTAFLFGQESARIAFPSSPILTPKAVEVEIEKLQGHQARQTREN